MTSSHRGAGLAPVVASALSAVVMAAAVALARYGLDFVDESYWLALIADPGAHRDNGEIFLIGFLLHPVYAAVGHDVALLRVVGILGCGAVAAWMGVVVLGLVDRLCPPDGGATRARVWPVVVVAGAVVTAVTVNVRVPNYRSISLVGLMLATVALVWAVQGRDRLAGLLLGTAVWVTAAARPTTGVALLLVVAVVLVWSRALTWRLAAAAAAATVGAAALTMAVAAMTPSETWAYLARGYRQNALLGGHTSLRGMLGLTPPDLSGFVALGLPVLVAGLLLELLLRRSSAVSKALVVPAVLVFALCVGVVVTAPLRFTVSGDPNTVLSMGLLVPLWAVGLVLVGGRAAAADLRGSRPFLAVLGLLVIAPYVASVGTNLPFTQTMGLASTFWVLAALAVLRVTPAPGDGAGARAVLTTVVCLSVPATFLAMLVSQVGLVPARGPMTDVPVAGGTLRFSAEDARVMTMLGQVRERYGITDRTPVVDVSGIGAGYRFQLGPHPVGRAFFHGIFPGAEEATAYSLGWESCEEIAQSWLIYAEDNPWDVSPALARGAVDIPGDYRTVATFSPTQGPPSWRPLRMHVLEPTARVADKLGC